ncbi:MAG: hypothetical protein IJZ55_04775 [Lachnospiraceae bacterium]|nr:hypothetical protein [Lachnospiraceae bacterium]
MNVDVRELEMADYDLFENIKTALYRLWKFKLVVVLMTLVGLLASLVYISIVGISVQYRSYATIYSMVYGSYEDSTDGVKVMNTYASLLGSSNVCERAAVSLQDEGITGTMLKNMVSGGRIYLSGASSDSKSYGYRLALVTVSDSPEYVEEISNAMSRAFADEINDLLGTKTVQVVDDANGVSSAKSMSATLCIALFGAVAFILTCMVIFIKEFLSSRVYSVAQCESRKELILGMIPYRK